MKKIKFDEGLELEIDEMVLDDMEMLDAIVETQDSNPLKISVVVRKLLGDKQRKRLYDYLREDNGRVPTTKVAEAVTKIFNALGEEGKNS